MILSIDPSSQLTGYAVMRSLQPADLVECGRFKPSMAKGALGKLPDWLMAHMRASELNACWRIQSMMLDLQPLIELHRPRVAVIEIPSGLAGRGSKKGAKGSLTTYGMAAGVMLGTLLQLMPKSVAPVTERQWTKDRGEKYANQAAMAAIYRDYNPAEDDGADVSDALGLGRWWLARQS